MRRCRWAHRQATSSCAERARSGRSRSTRGLPRNPRRSEPRSQALRLHKPRGGRWSITPLCMALAKTTPSTRSTSHRCRPDVRSWPSSSRCRASKSAMRSLAAARRAAISSLADVRAHRAANLKSAASCLCPACAKRLPVCVAALVACYACNLSFCMPCACARARLERVPRQARIAAAIATAAATSHM